MNRIIAVQECDATAGEEGTDAGYKIVTFSQPWRLLNCVNFYTYDQKLPADRPSGVPEE